MSDADTPTPNDNGSFALRGLQHIPYAIDSWCPIARSSSLKRGALMGIRLLSAPIVLFRSDAGEVHALEDRCPHRGVELSLGRVCGDAIQCAYHGWLTDGSGNARRGREIGSPATPNVRCYPAAESHGLIWLFLGGDSRARSSPGQPPSLDAIDSGPSLDILLDMPVRAHWSLMLDNGIDLFHQHLHRDVPFFFRIDGLEGYGPEGTRFTARYKAQLTDNFGRRRPGIIEIMVERNVAALRFNNDLVIYGIATPRSADGRDITMWWLLRKSAPGVRGIVLRTLRYFIRRILERGFRQDCDILQSEQRAFDNGFRVTCEVNPIVPALHHHVEQMIVAEAVAKSRELLASGEHYPLERLARRSFIDSVRSGELTVISLQKSAIIRHALLDDVLPPAEQISFYRYGHFAVLP